ncbi:MAG: DUF1294 domain-containing protein [Lachnospiraceae bacterium]|nr:DUF1294 domain-containing protein [Lachnospiraceae bacterium]
MNTVMILLLYVIIINFMGFLFMFIDKRRSQKRAYRIPESTLFALALLGGSIGCLFGMYICRHKTRHWYFVYGMPAILCLQVLLLGFLIFSPLQIKFL